jgi:hypothetical protein
MICAVPSPPCDNAVPVPVSSGPLAAVEPDPVALAEAVAAAEVRAREHLSRNGTVILRYNHYKEDFPISDGRLQREMIDDKFGLGFAFPGARLHLTAEAAFSFDDLDHPWQPEPAVGVFSGLESGGVYWGTLALFSVCVISGVLLVETCGCFFFVSSLFPCECFPCFHVDMLVLRQFASVLINFCWACLICA